MNLWTVSIEKSGRSFSIIGMVFLIFSEENLEKKEKNILKKVNKKIPSLQTSTIQGLLICETLTKEDRGTLFHNRFHKKKVWHSTSFCLECFEQMRQKKVETPLFWKNLNTDCSQRELSREIPRYSIWQISWTYSLLFCSSVYWPVISEQATSASFRLCSRSWVLPSQSRISG